MPDLSAHSAPVSDGIIIAVARLVDDAQSERRDPSHSDIEYQIKRAGLTQGDPNVQGPPVGKAKRVRGTLSWALEYDPDGGQKLVTNLLSLLRGCGGFREDSANYIGRDSIQNAINAFRTEGYDLTLSGELQPLLLDSLAGAELTAALEAYIRRAKRGAEDAALVTGTGKDLLEATAAHILTERWGTYPAGANFPALLGQAFVALEMATPEHKQEPGEPPRRRLERSIYEAACAVNQLRNKEGTGHGRPWIPSITDAQARLAIELMGAIADYLLDTHKRTR